MSIPVLILGITLGAWAALASMWIAAKAFDRFAPKSWTVMSDAAARRRYDRQYDRQRRREGVR